RSSYLFAHATSSALVMHGAAIQSKGKSVFMPGKMGNGKSLLTSWLLAQKYSYLSDQLICLSPEEYSLVGLPCPLSLPQADLSLVEAMIKELSPHDVERFMKKSSETLFSHRIFTDESPLASTQLSLLLFSEYKEGTALLFEPLSSAQAAQRLMSCLANSHHLRLHGFPQIAALTRQVPALSMHYADFSQLENILPAIINFTLESSCSPQALQNLIQAFTHLTPQQPPLPSFPLQQATPRRTKRKITIGMATYDDFDGVYFSIQALRLYHPEVINQCEILVIDNHPDGPCAKSLKELEESMDNYRYIPLPLVQGTAAGRNALFQHASGDYVLCIDCHVLLVPGAIKKLIAYFTANPASNDLIQGPMIDDDLQTVFTHFQPIWQEGMYGVWGNDPRAENPAGEPIEIPMQGLGLFACRKAAWLRFHPRFYGFGGEEGYIHEKFRQAGGKTLCLPFLRWLHRFARPMGTPYSVEWQDRIHNYLLGFEELGLDTLPIQKHFIELLGSDIAQSIFKKATAKINSYEALPRF
ncbi:MAG: glycosyltransferase, partial [Candidatus Electrothrix sp. AR3]|nr:glycosyltransferase [Candidatus Electrothrix sp. AR3]